MLKLYVTTAALELPKRIRNCLVQFQKSYSVSTVSICTVCILLFMPNDFEEFAMRRRNKSISHLTLNQRRSFVTLLLRDMVQLSVNLFNKLTCTNTKTRFAHHRSDNRICFVDFLANTINSLIKSGMIVDQTRNRDPTLQVTDALRNKWYRVA